MSGSEVLVWYILWLAVLNSLLLVSLSQFFRGFVALCKLSNEALSIKFMKAVTDSGIFDGGTSHSQIFERPRLSVAGISVFAGIVKHV